MQESMIFFLLIIFFTSTRTSASSFQNFFEKGSSFSVEDASTTSILSSPDKTFTCGFYNVGNKANSYWFSIWFTNSEPKTVVWMANRDKPVNGHGSRLTLRKDGALVLTDYGGSISWLTNTTSKDHVDRLELQNSGNLVLKDTTGKILWQSFDFPTDTLLPGQLFTKSKSLVSRIGPNMFGSGYFNLLFDNDNVLKLIYDGPEISSIYWPDPGFDIYQNGRTNYNNSRIAIFDSMGSFVSSDQLQFSASDLNLGIKRRLTIDYDGNLRLYSLNSSSGLWLITWQALAKLCDVHGLCGKNGICTYIPKPTCSCLPNYEVVDLHDWRRGCKPKFPRSHNESHFNEILQVDFFGFDLNYSTSISFENCRELCLGDYRCQGFKYRSNGQGICFTKSALFNGYRSEYSLYVRVPKSLQTLVPGIPVVSDLDCGNEEGKILLLLGTYYKPSPRFNWVYLSSFALALGIVEIILLVVGWFFFFRKQGLSASMENGYRAISSQFRSFGYTELKVATSKFKEVLGKGGFGAVYKGVLSDERVVAVKALGDVVHGEEEFWAEVSTIGRINHMNLARMWGFCSEGKYRLLVYEYIENGSLDKHLFSKTLLLGWKERFKVAIGTAKGLAYLHHECLEWVIHCDVKPENILLDVDFEPKISDFGLAKLCQRGDHGLSELTRIRGTKGYMAPEWTMDLPITAKVDVYSYGVVILELVKGIRLSSRVVDGHRNGEETSELLRLVTMAKMKIKNNGGEGSWIEELVDPRLEGQFSRNQAATMIELGISCVEEDKNKRPTMESVAQVLLACQDDTVQVQPLLS